MKYETDDRGPLAKRLTAGALGVLAIAPAIALAGAPFAIDGVNIPDAGAQQFSDPHGSVSELGPVNSNSTKLNAIGNATPAMLEFTNPNVSTDLANIWLDVKRDDATKDVWLYFAWEREPSNGSSTISYEFQAAALDPACDYSGIDQVLPEDAAETALIAACNPWANRQTGDFMIVWDFDGAVKDPLLRYFDGSKFGNEINLGTLGFAEATVNATKTRGEAAINLSQSIFKTLDSCFSVANVIPGTITGNSDNADYKDTVLANVTETLTISNCGSVVITKDTVPAS